MCNKVKPACDKLLLGTIVCAFIGILFAIGMLVTAYNGG